MESVPYWRLSGFYLFYFGLLGALIPYWGLYLQFQGFDAESIGELMAIIAITKLIAPNVWSWIAAHSHLNIALVRVASLLSLLCFLGVFFGNSFLWIALVMGAFSFFWNASLPQIEATTFAHLGDHFHRYSHIRLWGSIGFIIMVWLLGHLFKYASITLLPILLTGLFANIWLMSLLVPEHHGKHPIPPLPFREVASHPRVIALILVCFLMQMSHGPYYTFYSIFLESHGYSANIIGQLWALGVIAEVGVFLVMHHWLARYQLATLLSISFVLAGVRWFLIGTFVDSLLILFIAQTFHAASYGLFHGVVVQLIRCYFPGRLQARGQALYSSVSFGIGGALGSLLSGYLWNGLGGEMTYLLASMVCIVGVGISWFGVRGRKKRPPKHHHL